MHPEETMLTGGASVVYASTLPVDGNAECRTAVKGSKDCGDSEFHCFEDDLDAYKVVSLSVGRSIQAPPFYKSQLLDVDTELVIIVL